MSLPLLLSFILSFLFVSLAQSETYYLQVSHQAPTSYSILSFSINGIQVSEFQNISYGYGSSWIDVSHILPSSHQATILVKISDGENEGEVLSRTVTLKPQFQSFFVISKTSNSLDTVLYSWDVGKPGTATWFVLINLSPSHTDPLTISVNGDALSLSVDYKTPSDLYTSIAGSYSFEVSKGLIEGEWQFQPGSVNTIVLNDQYQNLGNLQFFHLKDWQSTSYSSTVRAVQSVPNTKIYVWFGGIEMWLGLPYSKITTYEFVGASETNIYISSTAQKPSAPTLTANFESYSAYSLLIFGDPESDVPIRASVVTDQNWIPLYTSTSVRTVFLSPSQTDLTVEVFINQQDVGRLGMGDATKYVGEDEIPVNLTLVSEAFKFSQQVDHINFGSAYSLFVMGVYEDTDFGLKEVTDRDAGPLVIRVVETGSSDDDGDNGGGLTGGEIAGLVFGILFIVGLVVAGILYKIKTRQETDHPQNNYYHFVPAHMDEADL